MHSSNTRYIGLDVHKDTIAVAYAPGARAADVTYVGTIGARPCALDTRIRKLQSKATPLVFVDEAGPCGYWLSRDLTRRGHVCWGVAPSLMPQKASDRVTTDRRAREEGLRALQATKFRLQAFPLRHDIRLQAGPPWAGPPAMAR
jgi:transposase